VLFAEKLVRPGRLEPHVDGIEEVERAVAEFSPERVGARCGIEPSVILIALTFGRHGDFSKRSAASQPW
jgi:hypothetical protein